MPRVRIPGIVRLAQHVRESLASAPNPAEREKLRNQVARGLEQIFALLRGASVTERSLPLPSRRAIQFLKTIRWDAPIEPSPPPLSRRPKLTVRLPSLSTFARRTLALLAEPQETEKLEQILRSLRQASDKIQHALRTAGASPEELTRTARESCATIRFLASEQNLSAYVRAVATARAIFEPYAQRARCRSPLIIHFKPMPGLYSYRSSQHGTEVRLPLPMIAFDESSFTDMARLMFARETAARERVVAAMEQVPYQSLRKEIDELSGVTGRTRGAVHDLNDSFDRVNAQYFKGQMQRPRLIWSRTFTHRKMGHYQHASDTVMISASLDHPSVPASTLDFLMYHELLHKKHGVRWKNGRGLVHTHAFYADERKFPDWETEEQRLEKIAEGIAAQ